MVLRGFLLSIPVVAIISMPAGIASAQEETGRNKPTYTVQPGDKLLVSVWNEPDLQKELLVAPDGGIAFPLVGEMSVVGKSILELRQEFQNRLTRYKFYQYTLHIQS